ncbi:hypothetical protein [Paractinoplanes globisporus]|uniref:Uncharacterized protein n=1 Tax=Paractinoplanes globisporus TaxID=113565 RepID=A0ABW6W7H4_9ACTN|nr:hypothetical protein [Actinoplanes globisporus]
MVRLLVLLGAVVAVYLVLSLFDHAARADVGSIDHIGATDPADSVKAVDAGVGGGAGAGGGAGKVIAEKKLTIPKAHPRPTIKKPEIHSPKIHAPTKIHAPKIQTTRRIQAPSIRAGEAVRRVQVRASKLRAPTSDAVRTAIVRQKALTSVQRSALPEVAELPDLRQAELPALPQLPSLPRFTARPQLPSWPQPPALPQAWAPMMTRTVALFSAPVPHPPLMPPVPGQVRPLVQAPAFASAPGLSGVTEPPAFGLSGVTEPPAAQAQPRTRFPAAPRTPLPAPLPQPDDRSTPAGQARDSGGGNAPAMGTLSSSWRPEMAVGGRRVATDLIARGRTVRYAGPPS